MTDNHIARGSEVNVGMAGTGQETRSIRRRQVEQLVASGFVCSEQPTHFYAEISIPTGPVDVCLTAPARKERYQGR